MALTPPAEVPIEDPVGHSRFDFSTGSEAVVSNRRAPQGTVTLPVDPLHLRLQHNFSRHKTTPTHFNPVVDVETAVPRSTHVQQAGPGEAV